MATLDRIIDELASRQHGSLGIDQLRRAGATRDAIRHQLARRRLLRGPHPGTFRHGAHPPSWMGRLWAAQLWGGEGCVLSHEAAGALYELDGCPPDRVVLTVAKGRRRRHPSITLHESTRPVLVRRLPNGLRVTIPEVTIVDLAAVLGCDAADDALHCALRRRLTTAPRVARFVDGRPGSTAARELLRSLEARPRDSRLEGRFVRLARAAGLRFRTQYAVVVEAQVMWVDFADPDAMTAIEVDGFATHGTREAFQRDRTRDVLLQLAGWRVFRFTWDDIEQRPEWVIRCVVRALAA